jgi:hypothetical protein
MLDEGSIKKRGTSWCARGGRRFLLQVECVKAASSTTSPWNRWLSGLHSSMSQNSRVAGTERRTLSRACVGSVYHGNAWSRHP